MTKPRTLPLDSLCLDGGTQVRIEINKEKVREYAELMAGGTIMDPIQVYYDGEKYYPFDGFHRIHAAKEVHQRTIKAVITVGSREQAVWASLAANSRHGLPLSTADKANAIKIALRLHPKHGDNKIAAHIGVSHSTVAKYRKEMESTCQIGKSESRVGADGRITNTGRIGTKPAPDPKEIPFDLPEKPAAAPEVAAPSEPSELAEDETPTGQDTLGRPLDAKLSAVFARREEINKLTSKLSDVKSAVLDACAAHDPLYMDLNVSAFKADIINAFSRLRAIRPHAICPYCSGDGCKACHGRGWVCRLVYETAPGEMK